MNRGDYLECSYATRDTAVQECKVITKRDNVTLFVVDSTSIPSLLLGACSNGKWRNATGTCKDCKGSGNIKPAPGSWGAPFECTTCCGFGVKIEPEPWSAK
jgi:hypothetical protein